MRFILLGYDGTDADAPARRAAARAAHLEGAKTLCDAGIFQYGGALLDKEGKMIGSMMVLEYPSEEALRAEFFPVEPYVTMGVWQEIVVHPFGLAGMFGG
ncbi:MAG: YciI family protein [Oscillospiraceae bacterium]|nr:YciI family protein [Oscillospiraceae bacterium]